MCSLAASSDVLTVVFNDKLVVLNRTNVDKIENEQTLQIHSVAKEPDVAVYDGSVPWVCSAISPSKKYFACCANKTLSLWKTSDWKLVSSKSIVRSASAVAFSNAEDKIVISDKSGDAFVFEIQDFNGEVQTSGELLLGHVSMLMKIVISPDDRFVVTCDRDEKIRVSHFPNAYNIQTFCLGHTDSVTSVEIPKSRPDLLISGSSDGTVRIWDYTTGRQTLKYDCLIGEHNGIVVDVKSLALDQNTLMVCVILNKYNNLRLLTVDHTTMKCSFLRDVPLPQSSPRSVVCTDNEVYVLSYDGPNFITAFRINGRDLALCSALNDNLRAVTEKFTDNFEKIRHRVTDDRLLSYFNKRKVDDTQDYYKKKSERLSGNVNKIKS